MTTEESDKDQITEEEIDDSREDLFEHHKLIADIGQDALRIDKFLMTRIPNVSRNRIQNIAKAGTLVVNGKSVKSNYKVRPKDEISVVLPYPVRETKLIPEDIPIEVVYEDDQMIMVNKPANMVVHPGYGNYSGTLLNGLVYHFENLPQREDYFGRPGLVHRLDKHTTGILVVAKTEQALTCLAQQFHDRTSERVYHALVWGDVPDEGRVEAHIGRSHQDRKVQAVFPDGEEGKHAVTHYRVLERLGPVTLVECKLETGRTHQIRVHMQYIGHPLFGDKTYGGDKIIKGLPSGKYNQFVKNNFEILPRQALHAKSLGFLHPGTGEFMRFESDLPEDMTTVLDRWRRYLGAAQTP